MNASCKPSIASEVHASHKRPYRLALLATFPVATGEAKIGPPARGRKLAFPSAYPLFLLEFKNQNPARGRSIPPASPARAGEGES